MLEGRPRARTRRPPRLLPALAAAGFAATAAQVLLLRELLVSAAGDEGAIGTGLAAWLIGITLGAPLVSLLALAGAAGIVALRLAAGCAASLLVGTLLPVAENINEGRKPRVPMGTGKTFVAERTAQLKAANEELDPEAMRLLGLVRDASTRMGRLTEALLRLSRVGRQQLRPERIDMTALARSEWEEFVATDEGAADDLRPGAEGGRANPLRGRGDGRPSPACEADCRAPRRERFGAGRRGSQGGGHLRSFRRPPFVAAGQSRVRGPGRGRGSLTSHPRLSRTSREHRERHGLPLSAPRLLGWGGGEVILEIETLSLDSPVPRTHIKQGLNPRIRRFRRC